MAKHIRRHGYREFDLAVSIKILDPRVRSSHEGSRPRRQCRFPAMVLHMKFAMRDQEDGDTMGETWCFAHVSTHVQPAKPLRNNFTLERCPRKQNEMSRCRNRTDRSKEYRSGSDRRRSDRSTTAQEAENACCCVTFELTHPLAFMLHPCHGRDAIYVLRYTIRI